jgi:hypothetical protein
MSAKVSPNEPMEITGEVTIDSSTPVDVNLTNPAVKLIDTNDTAQGVSMENGAIRTQDYLIAVAEGEVANHTSWLRLGYVVLGTGGGDIWAVGGNFVFPTGAMQMEVVSSSASDSSAGSGVRTVRIYYLKDDYTEATTDVILNGVTPVATSVSDIFRINHMRAITVGSGYAAAGNIDIRHISDTPIYARMLPGYTRTRHSAYTVPAGKRLFITSIVCGVSKTSTTGNSGLFTLRATYDDELGATLTPGLFFMPHFEVNLTDQALERHFEIPEFFPSTTDLKMSCIPGQNSTVCTVSMRGWIEPNP